MGLLESKRVADFVKAALDCSVYLAPTDYGLTDAELVEIGRLAGFQAGELRDAYQSAAAPGSFGEARYYPTRTIGWSQFHFAEEPEFRNVAAFEFVCSQLKDIVRAQGKEHGTLDRQVVVARAVAKGLAELDVEAAIAIMLIDEHLVENDRVLRFAKGRDLSPLPSEQIRERRSNRVKRDELREKAHGLVKDIIARRTDGRRLQSEPLDAFGEMLPGLGYERERLWWNQLVAELRRADPNLSAVCVAVLAASLVEASLVFIVRRARELGLRVFASKDFDGPYQQWRTANLVASAATGGEDAVLDNATRLRAEQLNRTRQRIHVARMLQDFPDGAADLRPEEAREAKSTADLVVRRVIDWVTKHPARQAEPAGDDQLPAGAMLNG